MQEVDMLLCHHGILLSMDHKSGTSNFAHLLSMYMFNYVGEMVHLSIEILRRKVNLMAANVTPVLPNLDVSLAPV